MLTRTLSRRTEISAQAMKRRTESDHGDIRSFFAKKICGSTDRPVNEPPRNELVSTSESTSSVSNTGRLENV